MLIEKLLGVLSGVTLAALVLSLVGQITGQSLLRQLFTGPLSGGPDQAPGQTNESFTPAQLPAVTEKPVVTDRLTARQRETSDPSEVTGTASREPRIKSRETSPQPRVPQHYQQFAAAPQQHGQAQGWGTREGSRKGPRPQTVNRTGDVSS